MAIHGFVLEGDTKPVDEHHLQAFSLLQACLSIVYRDFKKATPPNSLKFCTLTNHIFDTLLQSI
jgi:hypothetical protein